MIFLVALLLMAPPAAEKEPAAARRILSSVTTAAREVKAPAEAAWVWGRVAEVARAAQDPERLEEALKAGMAACLTLYKEDSDAKSPNLAPREFWPSSQHFRTLVHVAGEAFGPKAEAYLAQIPDTDLQLLARIELARALLGKPRETGAIVVSRKSK